jgi:XisI protein
MHKADRYGGMIPEIEESISNRLVVAGMPNQDIVLALPSPFKGTFTDFAVG